MIESEFNGYFGDDCVTLQPFQSQQSQTLLPQQQQQPLQSQAPSLPSIQYPNSVVFPIASPSDVPENVPVEPACGKVKNLPLIDESQLPKVKRGRRRRFVVDPKEEIKAIKEKQTRENSASNKRRCKAKNDRSPTENSEGNSSESSSDEDYYDNKDPEDDNETGNEMDLTPGSSCVKKNARESIKKKRNREAAQQFRLRQKIYIKGLEEKLKQGEATQKDLAEEIKKSEQINNELKMQIAESQNFLTSLIPLIRWNYESMFSVNSQGFDFGQQQQQQQQSCYPMAVYEGADMSDIKEGEND